MGRLQQHGTSLRSAAARVSGVRSELARWFYSFESTTQRIAILHHGRSGSSVLGAQLAQHPRIAYDFEVFNPSRTELRREQDAAGSVEAFLRGRIERASRRCYMFEMKPFSEEVQEHVVVGLPFDEVLAILDRLGFGQFVLLERRNYVRRTVSALIGLQSGLWHLEMAAPDPGPKRKVCFPLESREALIDRIAAYRREFDSIAAALPADGLLRLSFEEDLRRDPAVAYRRVCEFVGIRAGCPAVTQRRVNAEPLSDLVENYDDLARALEGTDHAWMLGG